MNNIKNTKAYWVIGGAIVLSVLITSFTGIFKSSIYYLFDHKKDDISVTGSASMNFESNLIMWSGSFSKRDLDLKTAYKKIKEDRKIIQEFLISKGVSEDEIIFKSIEISKKYKYKSKYNNEGDKVDTESIFDGYILDQTVSISSINVNLIEQISNQVTDLIEKDVFISSNSPKYYYTNLGELKIEMIKLAAENGHLRAQTAVEGGEAELGELLETSIGVFQILGKNSDDEFSWGGTLNTLNKYKTAYINVKQRFEIE
tara:strand:+ start:1981 stop:2754 length:774 start_codon:yes stop_codon:yes gene_type:complete